MEFLANTYYFSQEARNDPFANNCFLAEDRAK